MTPLAFAGFALGVMVIFVGGFSFAGYGIKMYLRTWGPCTPLARLLGLDFGDTVDRSAAMLAHGHLEHNAHGDVTRIQAEPCSIYVTSDPNMIVAIERAIADTPGKFDRGGPAPAISESRQLASPNPAMAPGAERSL